MGEKKTIFLAFLVGFVAGGITALLLAPASGEEVRRKIKDEVERTTEKLKAEAEALKEKAEELSVKAKEVLKTKKEEIKEAIEKGKEAIKEKKEELASKLLKKEEEI
uniref:YtxH domain-containing protein n=1 Tax=Thermodesulfobacterium geofontis TaxID=1295609 RepID=A0A7V5XFF3_9BACT